jgi:hypothetical protein
MCRVDDDTPYVTRITKGVLEQPVFTLDLKKNTLRMYNCDGYIVLKQADIAALLDLLAPFDYRLERQTFLTYFPMDLTRLTSSELIQAAQESSEEMVALDVCICDKPMEDYVSSLGETKAEALYFKESHRFGIMCHDYGYTRWLKGRGLVAAMQFLVDCPSWLTQPEPPPLPGWERFH